MPCNVFVSAVALFFSVIPFSSFAQNAELRISEAYNAVIKESPNLKIAQVPGEPNYFVYGTMHFYEGTSSGSIIKIDATGKRLESFATVSTDAPITQAVVLPGGKVLVMGNIDYINGDPASNITMLNSDGTPDPSFSYSGPDDLRGIVVQSDGRIIVSTSNEIFRLNADGSPDANFTGFSHTNFISAPVLDSEDNIYVNVESKMVKRLDPNGVEEQVYIAEPDANVSDIMIADSEGRLIISTYANLQEPPYQTYALQRFLPDGTRDDGFSSPEYDANVTGIALSAGGNILITGYFVSLDGQFGNVFELNNAGEYVSTIATTDFNDTQCLYIDEDNNIFITGSFSHVNGTPKLYAAKLNADHILDEQFTLPVGRTLHTLWLSSAIDSNGQLIVGGIYPAYGAGANGPRLFRLNNDGSIDTSFNPKINTGTANGVAPTIAGIIAQDDNVVIAGNRLTDDGLSGLLRLLPNGDIDNTFNSNLGSGSDFIISSIRQFDTKIYVYGHFQSYDGNPCNGLAILDMDGNFLGPVNPGTSYLGSYYQDMEVQSDGKLIVMGNFLEPSDGRGFIRINPDGSLDETFNLEASNSSALDFTIDSKDRVVVAGYGATLLRRFNTNGSPDLSLVQGTGFTPDPLDFVTGYTVKTDAEDNIMIGGIFTAYNGNPANGIAILDEQGNFIFGDEVHDVGSFPLNFAYHQRRLIAIGHFSAGHGMHVSSATQVVFPIINNITDFKVDAVTDATMDLSWQNAFEGADKIILEKSLSPDGPFSSVAELKIGQQAYHATGLEEATRYVFRISGENEFNAVVDGGDVADTTAVTAIDALPATHVTVSSFVANWENVAATDSVEIQLSSDDFVNFEKRYTTEPSLAFTNLEEGKSYRYRVRRFRNGFASVLSSPTTAIVITSLEERRAAKINVSPNPASSYVTITLPGHNTEGTAQLTTVEGKVYEEFNYYTSTFTLSLSHTPPGLLLLRLKSKQGLSTAKILKVN